MTVATMSEKRVRKPLWDYVGKPINASTVEEVMEQGGLQWSVSKRPLLTPSALPNMENRTNPTTLSPNGTEKNVVLRGAIKDLIDNPNDIEALHNVGQDWKATENEYIPIQKFFAIVRDDINEIFATVGGNYTTISNRECIEVLSELMDNHNVKVYRVGTFDNGAVVWIAAELPEVIEVKGHIFRQFIKISWSHDASERLTARFFYVSESGYLDSPDIPGAKTEVAIRHTKSAPERTIEAKSIMAKQHIHAQKYKAIVEAMFETPCENFKEYMLALFPKSMEIDENGDVVESKEHKTVTEIESVFNSLSFPIAGTIWGAYAAVQDFAEDKKIVRVHGQEELTEVDIMNRRDDLRLRNNIKSNGTAMAMKQKAWNILTAPSRA